MPSLKLAGAVALSCSAHSHDFFSGTLPTRCKLAVRVSAIVSISSSLSFFPFAPIPFLVETQCADPPHTNPQSCCFFFVFCFFLLWKDAPDWAGVPAAMAPGPALNPQSRAGARRPTPSATQRKNVPLLQCPPVSACRGHHQVGSIPALQSTVALVCARVCVHVCECVLC